MDSKVLRICEYTFNASILGQGAVSSVLLSIVEVPSSGIFGIVVWMVSLVGSNTKSPIGCELCVEAVLLGSEASQSLADTLSGEVDINRGRCKGPN